MNHSNILEAQSAVGQPADFVFRLGVRSKLGTTLCTSPLLGGLKEGSPDPPATGRGLYIPPFQVGDTVGPATLRTRPDRKLSQADHRLGCIHRKKNGLRFTGPAGKELLNLAAMF